MGGRPGISGTGVEEFEAGDASKDRVVGDERDVEEAGGGCDPAVGFVGALGQAVAGFGALGAQVRVLARQARTWPDDLHGADVRVQSCEAFRSPPGPPGAVAKFGDRDEGDDDRASIDQFAVLVSERPPLRAQVGAEDTGVEQNRRHAVTLR